MADRPNHPLPGPPERSWATSSDASWYDLHGREKFKYFLLMFLPFLLLLAAIEFVPSDWWEWIFDQVGGRNVRSNGPLSGLGN